MNYRKTIIILFIICCFIFESKAQQGTISIKKKEEKTTENFNGVYELELSKEQRKIAGKKTHFYLWFVSDGLVYRFRSQEKPNKILELSDDYMSFARFMQKADVGEYYHSNDTLKIKFDVDKNKASHYTKYFCIIEDKERLEIRKTEPNELVKVLVYNKHAIKE